MCVCAILNAKYFGNKENSSKFSCVLVFVSSRDNCFSTVSMHTHYTHVQTPWNRSSNRINE